MAEFQNLDLGRILQTAEAIKGMKREGENDRVRNLYMGEQMANARQAGQIAASQEQRAAAQFSQEQQVANTKMLNAASAEVMKNPAAAERWIPQLQQAGVIDPKLDWRQIPPEALQARAGELFESTSSALQALEVTGGQRFAADEAKKNREQTFSNQKELASIQHKYSLEEIGAKGKFDADNRDAANDHRQFRDIQGLRKEFEGMEAVKNYKLVLPLYERAANAPNTRAGDISIIYSLGKMFDPTSVVREGELILAKDAAPWLQKIVSSANSQITGKGALSPEVRADILQALKGQVSALEQPYNQERERFSRYAQENNWNPDQVVGLATASSAFEQPAPGGAPGGGGMSIKPKTNAKGWALHQDANGNFAYVGPNGEVEEVQ